MLTILFEVNMKKILLMFILILSLFSSAIISEEASQISDDEMQNILSQMLKEQNSENDYIVLPENVEIKQSIKEENAFKLLILGIDTHNEEMKGRADTIMLASLSGDRLKIISFMRDTYVDIPGKGHNKINAAYAFGQADLLKKTLNKNFSLKVDGYIAVNFSLMRKLVDEIGGVYVDVLPEELKSLNGIMEYYNKINRRPKAEERLKASGYQNLTGLQAMSYARIRKMDSDYERTGRQQRVISAIFHKLKEKNTEELVGIVTKYISSVKTDITMAQAMELISLLLETDYVDIKYLRIPTAGARNSRLINGTYFIVPNYRVNTEEIAKFLSE